MNEQHNQDWYSNKDLFEMLQNFKKEFSTTVTEITNSMKGLGQELAVTRAEIKQYNNLRGTLNTVIEDVVDIKKEITEIKSEAKGKKAVGVATIAWTSFGIGIITLLAKMTGWF